MGEGAQLASPSWGPGPRQKNQDMEMYVLGRSSQALAGEIGLSEIQNVFAEVSICPERIKLLQKSLCGTHFEATATRFEFCKENHGFPGAHPGNPLRFLLVAAATADARYFSHLGALCSQGFLRARQRFFARPPEVF